MTDANLVAGRIDPAGTLAATLPLHPEPTRRAVGAVGEAFGLDVGRDGVGHPDRGRGGDGRRSAPVSVEEGADPNGAHLVAFGGAGGLHATALARSLGMAGVMVPAHAGVFSALGLLLSPPRIDLARSRLRTAADAVDLAEDIAAVRAAAVDRFTSAGAGIPASVDVRVDVRYRGQSHELSIPWSDGDGWDDVAAAFHDTHRRRNGFARPDDPIEVVTVRVEVDRRAGSRHRPAPPPISGR